MPKKPAKPPPPEPRIISGDQKLAEHYGVTTKTVYLWRGQGLPAIDRGRGWDYDLDKTDPWVRAMREEDGDESGEAGKLTLEIRKAKLRIEKSEADRLERQEQEARGNILPLDEYRLFAAETIQDARDHLLRIPRQLRTHLCKKCQSKITELETMIHKSLQQLARLSDGPPKE